MAAKHFVVEMNLISESTAGEENRLKFPVRVSQKEVGGGRERLQFPWTVSSTAAAIQSLRAGVFLREHLILFTDLLHVPVQPHSSVELEFLGLWLRQGAKVILCDGRGWLCNNLNSGRRSFESCSTTTVYCLVWLTDWSSINKLGNLCLSLPRNDGHFLPLTLIPIGIITISTHFWNWESLSQCFISCGVFSWALFSNALKLFTCSKNWNLMEV